MTYIKWLFIIVILSYTIMKGIPIIYKAKEMAASQNNQYEELKKH